MWRHPYYYSGGMGWGMSPITMLICILFWVFVIVFLVKLFKHHKMREDDEDSALKVLRVRYAKGEIDKKKFDEMKKDLG